MKKNCHELHNMKLQGRFTIATIDRKYLFWYLKIMQNYLANPYHFPFAMCVCVCVCIVQSKSPSVLFVLAAVFPSFFSLSFWFICWYISSNNKIKLRFPYFCDYKSVHCLTHIKTLTIPVSVKCTEYQKFIHFFFA